MKKFDLRQNEIERTFLIGEGFNGELYLHKVRINNKTKRILAKIYKIYDRDHFLNLVPLSIFSKNSELLTNPKLKKELLIKIAQNYNHLAHELKQKGLNVPKMIMYTKGKELILFAEGFLKESKSKLFDWRNRKVFKDIFKSKKNIDALTDEILKLYDAGYLPATDVFGFMPTKYGYKVFVHDLDFLVKQRITINRLEIPDNGVLLFFRLLRHVRISLTGFFGLKKSKYYYFINKLKAHDLLLEEMIDFFEKNKIYDNFWLLNSKYRDNVIEMSTIFYARAHAKIAKLLQDSN